MVQDQGKNCGSTDGITRGSHRTLPCRKLWMELHRKVGFVPTKVLSCAAP